jgi:hypothetical protein
MDNTTLLIIVVVIIVAWFLVIQPNMNRTTPTPTGGARHMLPSSSSNR